MLSLPSLLVRFLQHSSKRKQTIESAKALNPARWGGREVRECTPVPPTTLNPVKEPKSIDKMRVA